ncbi:putative hemK methyltransferase family member 1 [Scophthalmus maximus]|uniref:peptide chain release factor N(5)-glutamine methyltransferase n=1 Tax=Scophthalmus maximus TaxID=52904 RepID=A0A2U9BFX3_SCOMX|nr:MTRF1L release factor glutamine methyltransferase [Scophthalmus maximus]AWP02636.1 putative hemK methyltransferase family member 1 [Scophthalmus maximus]
MWRRSFSAGYRCLGRRRIGPKGTWASRAARACSVPASPAGGISALQALDVWEELFEERGVSEPKHSADHIVAHLLGAKTRESLGRRNLTEILSRERTEQLWELCTRRLSRMPVQYVIEQWDFRDLTLKMRPPVFIPRPETEELVELVLMDLEKTCGQAEEGADAPLTCLEVGCGSGAISLSLLSSLPQLKAIALDRSQDAVDLTRENASSLGLQDRLQIYHIDVMKDPEAVLRLCSPVSALVSNPPYLFSEDMLSLEPEILRFEDPSALDGGQDGLDVIRQILTMAPKVLSDHGRAYLEVDPRHPRLIRRWVEANVEELRYVETRHDITGRPRFCILQKRDIRKGP